MLNSPSIFTGLSLLIICLVLSACAAPQHSKPSSPNALQPWTPDRLGNHPATIGIQPPETPTEDKSFLQGNPVRATGYLAWRFYSHTFSSMTGDTCRFAPSCSRFALDAISEGPNGLILAFARLQRNQLDTDFYQHTEDGHLIDPTSHYKFWRSPHGLDAHQFEMNSGHAWYIFLRATDDLPEHFFDE